MPTYTHKHFCGKVSNLEHKTDLCPKFKLFKNLPSLILSPHNKVKYKPKKTLENQGKKRQKKALKPGQKKTPPAEAGGEKPSGGAGFFSGELGEVDLLALLRGGRLRRPPHGAVLHGPAAGHDRATPFGVADIEVSLAAGHGDGARQRRRLTLGQSLHGLLQLRSAGFDREKLSEAALEGREIGSGSLGNGGGLGGGGGGGILGGILSGHDLAFFQP